ncbi:DUF962 domain-containing protein [Simiduia aestuariiviva]|uniref:DUF962 domain-containing protein n=1 Tax=Simiduia aestuariiviva TaxID=1510459 RepID=A0A839ULX2_9GAMM|nr:DUF962 domain-containing protein [Simiduia aestuariiviva]MBB3169194.1 hypothetical protein [Simiduia aestuariiviva]
MSTEHFNSFREFYPYYLAEHANRVCRRMHFMGSTVALMLLVFAIYTLNPWWLLVGVLQGYGFAWVGHFYFEQNKPATFKYPGYSFIGDWVMYKDMLTGKLTF